MEPNNQNKTWAIVGTIAAVLFCGCPGLSLCAISIFTAAGLMPYTTTFNDYTSSGTTPTWLGWAGLCLSALFIAIAIIVPVLLFKKKKAAPAATPVDFLPPQEPLPPAS